MSVQQTIIKGIKEQLFFNNYLVLPGFGGFVLKSSASHFAASGGLLVPPSKTVSFNAQLKQNDGILALWLQNTLKCTASEALTHLNDFSEFCAGILNAKRRLSLEGIGFFYLDFENNICFEPQQDSNFLTNSFGLSAVSIKELEPAPVIEEPKKETIFIDRKLTTAETAVVAPKIKRNYRRLITPVLLVAILIGVLGLLVNNTLITGELRASLSGTNSKRNYAALSYPELTLAGSTFKPAVYIADVNGIASLELNATKKLAVKAIEKGGNKMYAEHKATSAPAPFKKGNFEIVLGCFAIRGNAERMVRKLSAQGIHAAVTGTNSKGMFVVGNGGYTTKQEAINGLLELKDGFPHAWIKKVN